MADQSKTIQGLTAENDVLKKRIRELEAVEVDRKRAEETLRHAANMRRATFDSLECAIWLLDKDMRIVAANRGTQMVLKRDPKEILGRHCWELVHGTQQPIAECPVVRSQRTRRRESMELQQGMQCFEVTADPVLDETAGIAGTVHVITDITERKTAEEELRKSWLITENIPVGLYLYHLEDVSDDRTLRMIYANPAVKALTGLGPEDVVGRTLDENFPGLRAQGIPQRYAEVVRSQTAITYEDMNYEDNRVLRASFSVRAFPLPGNHVGVIFENITERKRAEEALRKSEEKYRILIETTDTGYVFVDENGFVLDANKKYVRISGHGNLNEILGRSVIEWTAEVDKEKNALAVKSCFEKGFIRDFEISYTDQKGNLTPIEINATCLSVAEKKQTITLCRDITDRKWAEEALRESERKLTDIIEFLPDATLAIDRDKRIIVWNKAIEEITGIPAAEMIGQGDYAYTVPFYGERRPQLMDLVFEDSAETAARYPAITRRGDTLTTEVFCNALYSGRGAWVFAKASPLYDASGKIIGAIEIIRDVTDRKQAEDALKKLSLRQEALLTAIPDILMEVDANKVYSWANPAGYEFFGHDVIGREASYFFEGDQDAYSMVQPLFNGDESVIYLESWQRRKDGEKRLLAWWCRVLKDGSGRTVGALSTARDITEQKQAEDALRRNEKDLRESQRIAHVGSWRLDVVTDKVVWTEELYDMYGFDSSLPPPPYTEHMKLFTPESWDRLSKALARTSDTGIPYTLELETIRKDGSNGWMWVHGQADVDSTGKTVGLWGAAQDITERKRAEEENRLLQERLNRSEKMESLGMLAGGVAHDLNNVLGVVLGYSELLASSLETSSPLQSQVEKIMKGTERAAEIIQDLLTLARRGVQTRSPVSINDVIMNFLKSSEYERILLCNPRMRVNADLQADILNMMGSKIHLHKTIMNLVSNASDAMPDGGCLNIKTSNQYLDSAISGYDHVREGDYVVLSVSDTGEGISSDDIRHIFEPFYTKKVMGRSGTGLGLAVVWGTVKDHEGYIDVQSEVGKGTTFDLYFPVTREMVSDEKIPVSLSDYMGKGESVLVVDDVKGQRDLASEMLSRLNYKVASVPSGEAAVEYLKANRADILVLDMIMDPGMDGLDTYKEILKLYPGQKAVIVSGFSETDRVKKAHRLGAGAYVRKPYAMERLGLAVRRELDKK